MRFQKYVHENGNVVWDDGKHHVELPFEHQKNQLDNRYPSIAIIFSALVSSVVAVVSFFRSRRPNEVTRRQDER